MVQGIKYKALIPFNLTVFFIFIQGLHLKTIKKKVTISCCLNLSFFIKEKEYARGSS